MIQLPKFDPQDVHASDACLRLFLSAAVKEQNVDAFRATTEDVCMSQEGINALVRVQDHFKRYKSLPSQEKARQLFVFAEPPPGLTAKELRDNLIMIRLKGGARMLQDDFARMWSAKDVLSNPDELSRVMSLYQNEIRRLARPIGTYNLADEADMIFKDISDVRDGKIKYFPMGPWPTLNELVGGLKAGETCTTAGRPKAGKSQVLLAQAMAVWMAGNKVHFVSPELMRAEVRQRIFGYLSTISHASIRRARISNWAMERLERVLKMEFRKLPDFTIQASDNETFGGRMTDIIGEVDRIRPDALFIDAAYNITPVGNHGKAQWERLSGLEREYVQLAMDAHVPLYKVVQFNRDGMKTGDKWKAKDSGKDAEKEVEKKHAQSDNVAGTVAIVQNATVFLGLEYGKSPNEKSTRTIRVLESRVSDVGELDINFSMQPVDMSEIAKPTVIEDDGPEIPYE
jgi:replicative DNA helicase